MVRKIVLAAVLGLLCSGVAIAGAKVDLNAASAAKLAEALDGVGEVRAQAIVDYRQSNGGFASVSGLVAVDGIGEATLEKNRDRLTIGSE